MTHRTRVRGLIVRQAMNGTGTFGPTVLSTVTEWLIECDKCGRIDKAADEQTARARAARHEEMPAR